MSTERHDRIAERLEDYALGHLTPDERQDVEAHVRACAACTRDLHEIDEALALVADSAPAMAPPASLKGRVIAAGSCRSSRFRQPAMEMAVVGGGSGPDRPGRHAESE